MKPSTVVLTAAVVLSNVAGNFALNHGMKHAPQSLGPILALLQPWVMVGIGLLILWTAMRVKLLELADLSYVLPVTAVGYILNAAASAVFLGEQISAPRWAGTLLIVAGAALAGLERPEAKP